MGKFSGILAILGVWYVNRH